MSSSEEFASADEDVSPNNQSRKKKETKPAEEKEQKSGIRKLGSSTGAAGKPRVSKLGEKTVKQEPTKPQTPPQIEQCWEFESWDDYDKEQKSKSEKPTKKPDTDGWGSDDDWEEPVKPGADPSPKKPESQVQPEPRKSQQTSDDVDVSKVLDRLALGGSEQRNQGGGWGWKPWGGLSSFISTATESVATLTSHVSQGLSTVIESGMGVPDPSEMARQDAVEEKKKREAAPSQDPSPTNPEKGMGSNSGLGNFVSGVSQMSSKVLTGGLDTLEGIGKKTMNMLQENDPGLMNKRKMLGLDDKQPVLSKMLREAKTQSEEKERNMQQLQKNLYKKQLHFETLFDDYCGLVHLEALEMLSKQSTLKLESLTAPLSGKALKELQETMAEVKELCELPEVDDESDGSQSADDLESRLSAAFDDMETKVEFQDLVDVWRKDIRFLETDNPRSAQELYDRSLHSLAQTTAIAVNRMHKLAELLLIQEHHSTVNEADSLVQLTTTLCWHLGGIAARFGSMLSDEKMFVITDDEDVSGLITSIFLEGTNSTSYIQNAFQLFVPILQLGAA